MRLNWGSLLHIAISAVVFGVLSYVLDAPMWAPAVANLLYAVFIVPPLWERKR